MKKTINIIDVFLSAPSDTSKECSIVLEIAKEINEIWSRYLKIQFDISYYKDYRPTFESDAQIAVNKQMPENIDLYFSVLWNRIGTPTPRAISGTVEEFEIAYKKHQQNSNSIDLMIYFKKQNKNKIDIDLDQVEKVNKYKQHISTLGSFYKSFDTSDEFRNIVRSHLSLFIQSFSKKLKLNLINQSDTSEPLLQIVKYKSEYFKNFKLMKESHYKLNNLMNNLIDKQDNLTRLVLSRSPMLKRAIANFDRSVTMISTQKINELKNTTNYRKNAYASFSKYLMWLVGINKFEYTELDKLYYSLKNYSVTLNKLISSISSCKTVPDKLLRSNAIKYKTSRLLKRALVATEIELVNTLNENNSIVSLLNYNLNKISSFNH